MFVIKPAINLNGTSPRELLDQQITAISALRTAISALQAAAPNGRDYQTEVPGAFLRARHEHLVRVTSVEIVLKELEQIAEHVSDHLVAN